MINLNNNNDYAFSQRKKGISYGKATLQGSRDQPVKSKTKRERVARPKPKTKIVYVKEVPKPKKKKKKAKK